MTQNSKLFFCAFSRFCLRAWHARIFLQKWKYRFSVRAKGWLLPQLGPFLCEITSFFRALILFVCNSSDTIQYHGGLQTRQLGKFCILLFLGWSYHFTRIELWSAYTGDCNVRTHQHIPLQLCTCHLLKANSIPEKHFGKMSWNCRCLNKFECCHKNDLTPGCLPLVFCTWIPHYGATPYEIFCHLLLKDRRFKM